MPFVEFTVPGIPKPGGSKRAFPIKGKDGRLRVIVTDDCKTSKDWRGAVVDACRKVFFGPPTVQPLRVTINFFMPYRKGDFNKKGEIKPSAPKWHDKKPDTTKLIRSTEDALTGILWQDDSQIVGISATKEFGLTPGAKITVNLA
jgi:Holliday junction resolvase RusA-like endonuclease